MWQRPLAPAGPPIPVIPNAVGRPEGLLKQVRGDLGRTEGAELRQDTGA